MDIREIFKKYEETERIQGDCELTYVPQYNYEALVNEIIKVCRFEAPVILATAVERSGRDTDKEWLTIQARKLKKHINQCEKITDKRFTIEIKPIEGDWLRLGCAFMEYGNGLRDPAGYLIVSKPLSK